MTTDFSLQNPQYRMATPIFVLLSFASFGVFAIIFMWRTSPLLERHTQKSLNDTWLLYAVMMGYGLLYFFTFLLFGGALSMLEAWDQESVEIIIYLSAFRDLLGLLLGVLYLIWTFKAATMINEFVSEKNITLKVNKVYAFFFSLFYINFLINQLIEKQSN